MCAEPLFVFPGYRVRVNIPSKHVSDCPRKACEKAYDRHSSRDGHVHDKRSRFELGCQYHQVDVVLCVGNECRLDPYGMDEDRQHKSYERYRR